MALTPGDKQIVAIGVLEMVAALISIICGALTMSKMESQHWWLTFGIWALYFLLPAALCLAAGCSSSPSMYGLALAANIFGIIVAMGSVSAGAILWDILNTICYPIATKPWHNYWRYCVCGSSLTNYHAFHFFVSCGDLVGVIKKATAASTIMYAILLLVTFIGSIFGCIGACCPPQDQTMVVGAMQLHPQTFVVSSENTNTGFGYDPPGYSAQPGYYAQNQGGVPQQQNVPTYPETTLVKQCDPQDEVK